MKAIYEKNFTIGVGLLTAPPGLMISPVDAKEFMPEIAVNAEAAGHDLSGFRPVNAAQSLPNGYEARCRKCGRTAWVGEDGLMYSLLDSECSQT